MQDISNLEELKKETLKIIGENQKPHITLNVPSMLKETPEKIKLEIDLFNQIIEYLIKNGKQYAYITAEQNSPISYEELMRLEDIVAKSKQEIESRAAKTSVEKARVIEHIIAHELPTTVRFEDEDFYSSCDKNLIQAINEKKGNCCHFAALTQYVHLRNNMYSDMIHSGTTAEICTDKKIEHVFNLLFLSEENKWTFVDTMWEEEYLKIRGQNVFSFVSLEDIQYELSDDNEAHAHIEQDISNISTITIDMGDIDKKLGYHNKLCLFEYVYFIAYNIANGNIDKVKEIFNNEDKTIQNVLNKNSMLQGISLIAYISAIELGKTGLNPKEQRPDESVMIQCLDTYLGDALPKFYATFFKDRIKLMNTDEIEYQDNLEEYTKSLFQIVTKDEGSVGIYFNDEIDSAYIDVNFIDSKAIPVVNILNRIQFEEKFGTITNSRVTSEERKDYEI